ncbi:hypothetical protein Glove_84g9 [Diversispora epigaea]|uniref:Uncharacterized protein n=1 Tax=Diversispora epigaea TaxID=1348612 RepID=A0A397J8A2_9GLOM|nr:hypothetical protein Glove_84g9 [Diversispora epigaea]
MPQEIEKIEYCPAGHSSVDFAYSDYKNYIRSGENFYWITYDNFQNIQNIERIADGGHGSEYSAKLENGIKEDWNFIKQDWKYHSIGDEL